MHTKQSIYNLLVHSAYDGTFPSVQITQSSGAPKPSIKCRYRADGTAHCKQRCPIGLLIPDDRYDPAIEDRRADEVRNLLDVPQEILSGDDLCYIQKAHDYEALYLTDWYPANFVARLNELACFQDVEKVLV